MIADDIEAGRIVELFPRADLSRPPRISRALYLTPAYQDWRRLGRPWCWDCWGILSEANEAGALSDA